MSPPRLPLPGQRVAVTERVVGMPFEPFHSYVVLGGGDRPKELRVAVLDGDGTTWSVPVDACALL